MEVICYACGRGENPENSIEGIKHCQEVNPDWRVEMDLQITKDGEIVLFHDYQTLRTTGVEHKIQELDLSSINNLNPGYNFKADSKFPYRNNPIKIPTLEEVCQLFPDIKLLLDIHTNNRNAIDKIIDIIEQHHMEGQTIIVSHYDEITTAFKQKRPNWVYGAATKEVKNMVYSSFLFLDNIFPIKSDILMLPVKYGGIKLLTRRVVRHVKKRNKQLWVWLNEGKDVITVNSNKDFKEMQKMGVNGVFTEFPMKLNKELNCSR